MASESEAGRSNGVYPEIEETVVRQVLEAIRRIEFGSVLIKIHQGEVVGIETSTKLRLDRAKG